MISVAYANNNTDFSIHPLSAALEQNLINTKLWHPDCPVALSDLRLVTVKYYDFDGSPHNNGTIILNKSAAPAAAEVFKKLYANKFPIAAIDTLIKFNADTHLAEQKNITYGFICIKGADNKFTAESDGTVITLNPIQNPEIGFIQEKGSPSNFWCEILHHCNEKITASHLQVLPAAGMLSINRSLKLRGIAEAAVPTFTKYGFKWSGQNIKDVNWKKFSHSLAEQKK